MNRLSGLPQVEKLLSTPQLKIWLERLSRPLIAKLTAEVLEEIRQEVRAGAPLPPRAEILERLSGCCRSLWRRRLLPVINATGIILHTNLGRAPLAPSLWERAARVNTGYANLELELASGKRGGRAGLIPELLRLLISAPASLVVNNNAAGLLLLLTVLARDREVIVSRGEQVQIGGGFRIPEILALSGARLVEVGTTNVTRVADFQSALGPDTAMVLMVHSSNFKIRGFTWKPACAEIAEILPPGVLLAVDQGSGASNEKLPGETRAAHYLEQGAHLVCFSADKLLGGPQGGIIAGRSELIARLESHPLMRAFRPGKTVISLLEEQLVRRLNQSDPGWVNSVLSTPQEELRRRAETITAGLSESAVRIVDSAMASGGGSAPDETFPSLAVEITNEDKPAALLARLREQDPPVIGTISSGRVRLDCGTLRPGEAEQLADILQALLGAPARR
jgi:L-seryl-tRNA(Ser) seleniumtransferase